MRAAVALAALVGVVAWSTRDRWARAYLGESDAAPDIIEAAQAAASTVEDSFTDPAMNADTNIRAFLDALTVGEGTAGPDGYRILMGGGRFDSFADHPALLGWRGTPLSDSMCRAAGYGPGCVSTAAGRYQITKPTWARVKRALGLPDFGPDSQDRAAIFLIDERGALGDVQRGDIAAAVGKVRRVWASLPASGWGQAEVSMARFLNAYAAAGGQTLNA